MAKLKLIAFVLLVFVVLQPTENTVKSAPIVNQTNNDDDGESIVVESIIQGDILVRTKIANKVISIMINWLFDCKLNVQMWLIHFSTCRTRAINTLQYKLTLIQIRVYGLME